MSIKILNKHRGWGKTTQLIYSSEVTGYPIIVKNRYSKSIIISKALELKCNIPQPITVDEFINNHLGNKYKNVLVDEGMDLIEYALKQTLGTDIAAMTLTLPFNDEVTNEYRI